MSNCNTAATDEQPRTCGNCDRYHNVRPTMRQGTCPLDELDEHGCAPIHNEDDEACEGWREIEMPLEQRHEQLADVAREMLGCVLGHRYWPLRHKLEALGVSVDD